MKTLLYMAMSVNGCVADHKGHTPWSKDEWKRFKKIVQSCGNIIVGRRTYDIMKKYHEFERIGFPYLIIVSRESASKSKKEGLFVNTPREAVRMVRAAGYKKALIAGGTELNSHFIRHDLVDEIRLDVEPLLFSQGLPLLKAGPFTKKLKLIGLEKYKNGVALHYKLSRLIPVKK